MKKYILIFSAVLLLTPFSALAQTTLPGAGLTPESSFYFFDRIGEALQEFFTFNPEAKARLQITFAAERVAEIKIILETKGINAKGLEVAQSRFQEHLANIAAIVADQKAKGKDVSVLAKELDNDFDGPKSALKDAFKAEKQALETKEKELKVKIREARQAGDTAQVESLTKELDDVKAKIELLDAKKDDQKEALEQEEAKIEREMDKKEDAEKAIKEAENEKQEVLDEAAEEGVSIPADAFIKFDKLLTQAKELFGKENYVGAKQLARQAEKSLDDTDKAIENLKEAKDDEEEINNNNEGKEEQEQETNISPLPKNRTVKFEDGRFSPSEVKIKKGDTVTWTNNSSELVWPASAFHPTHQVYPGFDALKGLGKGESYSFKFDKIGSWKYHNHLNPSVTGIVVVE